MHNQYFYSCIQHEKLFKIVSGHVSSQLINKQYRRYTTWQKEVVCDQDLGSTRLNL